MFNPLSPMLVTAQNRGDPSSAKQDQPVCAGVTPGKRKLLLAFWFHLAGNKLLPAPFAFLTREGGSQLELLI